MSVPAPDPADTLRRVLSQYTMTRYRVNAQTLEPIPGSFERVPTRKAQRDALAALDALLAGRRQDKARIKWLEGEERGWRTGTLEQTKRLGECNAARRQDKERIERLERALEPFVEYFREIYPEAFADLAHLPDPWSIPVIVSAAQIRDAVAALAGEEDAE